jgi:Pertussis toxin, subunit 1
MSESFAGITVPPGEPGGVRSMASAMVGMAGALQADSMRLRSLPTGMGSWQGPASAAFAGACFNQTDGLSISAQAFAYAAGMSQQYASALHDAQHEARAAIHDARDATHRMEVAQRQLDDANGRAGAAATADAIATTKVLATGLTGSPSASALADQSAARTALADAQGDAIRAQRDLDAAKDDLDRAKRRGQRAEQAAEDAAQGYSGALMALGAAQLPPPPPPPPPPEHRGFFGSIGHAFSSGAGAVKDFTVDTAKGVGDFAVGMKDVAVMGWHLSPVGFLVDPEGSAKAADNLVHGLDYAVHNPLEVGKALIDWKDLTGGHPGRALGQLLPNIALAVATGGGGAAAEGAESANALSALSKSADAADVAVDASRTAKVTEAAGAAADAAPKDLPPITYRGDSRAPEDIFSTGFEPRGTSTDLHDYALNNSPSAFVGTSLSPEVGTEFAGPGGFRYMIQAPGGIDVNAALGSTSPFPHEAEIVFQGGIRPEHIMGAHPVAPDLTLGDFVHNPGFLTPAP